MTTRRDSAAESPTGRDPTGKPDILSVSRLTALIKSTLESAFPLVWVGGELSDVARPQSGHLYFTLKDAHAQVRGVMWRSTAAALRFRPSDGQEVVCLASVDVYPPRGTYQIVVRRMEPLGVGALQLALDQLRAKLSAEGLFEAAHKKRLPRFPRVIGLITSPTGAAVRDFLEILRRRWSGARVLLFPVRVQGEGASAEVVRAIRDAHRLRERPDVLVVTRGGGGLEDLWTFNEEPVVRAIHAAEIPVVSAIGHEIDVTLSDLAADLRALTPSEAAERVVPSREDLMRDVDQFQRRARSAILRRLRELRGRLDGLARRPVLARPFDPVLARSRFVDDLLARAGRSVRRRVAQHRASLAQHAAHLESLSPLAVLRRGYSITRDAEGRPIRSVGDAGPGSALETLVPDGSIWSRVERGESRGETPTRDGNT
ncbi:MAG: exodeoxyribonuclease VII large subunit [Planctomycetes bacterium]|nr:exodeoxyribonuclease VII large subunit [Planctomycetota bacterium]